MSKAFSGQSGNTPLVPSWLDDDGAPPAALTAPEDGASDGSEGGERPSQVAAPPSLNPLPPNADPTRFTVARSNFSRFARSGGRDRASLGRAVSHYVGSSAGGARTAAARMGSSRGAANRLVGFLADTTIRGAAAALKALNLEALAGRPIQDVFIGLVDYVCPDGGSIDEGIARGAFIETIADLAQAGITDLDGLTADQLQTVLELYATNAIEARICNDIGSRTVTLPHDPRDAAQVQAQLHDFIRRGVADALTSAQLRVTALVPDQVLGFVSRVYEQAFGILQVMGDAEAAK
ncbi:Qat anti-phage system associated protein QatB [Mycobacterium sp. TY815]|uniref:Qat anti-phage system associated protein QatB n=1 Tax=Mycobacterium sp. TY815 TaxID=3050581 RepID=UPI0027419701|nr:Qat anti-phage system associated protein QatB [Mycobacterium sp. TY815]MDP7701096.1 hypothetical protein [Mycobacterium sp. TY815]